QLLVGKIRIKLSRCSRAMHIRPRYDVDRLKDPNNQEAFQENIALKIRALDNENSPCGCEKYQKILLESAAETIGFEQRKKKRWITKDTWDLIANRKHIKGLMMNTKSPVERNKLDTLYKELNAAVKRSARKDRRQWADTLAQQQ